MKSLRDVVLEAKDAAVMAAVVRIYGQAETEWSSDAVGDVLAELRQLVPDEKGAAYQLHIERMAPLQEGEEPAWDVWCSYEGDAERYGLDLSPWEDWLAVRVPQPLLERMPAAEIAAHCVWEMTFYGFTQERVTANRVELGRRVQEIDQGKAVDPVGGDQESAPCKTTVKPGRWPMPAVAHRDA